MRVLSGELSATVDYVTEHRKEKRKSMRRNISGLLSQFGFGINNDLLAVLIVLVAFLAALGVTSLLGVL